jgi:hypothetical protein
MNKYKAGAQGPNRRLLLCYQRTKSCSTEQINIEMAVLLQRAVHAV